MKLTRVGVDLAKQVFQVHGVDRAERPAWCTAAAHITGRNCCSPKATG